MANSLGAFQTKRFPEYQFTCLIEVIMMGSQIESKIHIIENEKKKCMITVCA